MIVIGVDARERTHTLGAVDAIGRELAAKTVTASDGHMKAVQWVRKKFVVASARAGSDPPNGPPPNR